MTPLMTKFVVCVNGPILLHTSIWILKLLCEWDCLRVKPLIWMFSLSFFLFYISPSLFFSLAFLPIVIRKRFPLLLVSSQWYLSSSAAHLFTLSLSSVTFSFSSSFVPLFSFYLTSTLTERWSSFHHNNLTLQNALVHVPTTRQHDLRSQRAHSSVCL